MTMALDNTELPAPRTQIYINLRELPLEDGRRVMRDYDNGKRVYLTEEQQVKIMMLDAAADENGMAKIPQLGYRAVRPRHNRVIYELLSFGWLRYRPLFARDFE